MCDWERSPVRPGSPGRPPRPLPATAPLPWLVRLGKNRVASASLVLLGAFASCRAGEPARRAPDERIAFDGMRAFADLERQVAFGPRVPGTEPHRRTGAWLRETLEPLADELEADRFEQDGIPFLNLVARFRPDTAERVLLCAHWDSRPRADHDPDPERRASPVPGANDGASGTAVLLELARLFHRSPPDLGVDMVFFDGEDFGDFAPPFDKVLIGSRRFAQRWTGARPRLGILLDMVGDKDLQIAQEEFSRSCCRRNLEMVWQVAREIGYGHIFVDRHAPAVLDDHVPLNRVGLGVIDLIDLDYPAWHTTADTPDKTSPASLAAVGTVVAEVVYRLKPADRP